MRWAKGRWQLLCFVPQTRSITVTNPTRPYQLSVLFAIASAGVFLIELLGGRYLGVGAPAFHSRGAQHAELFGKQLFDLIGGGVSDFSRVENGFELSGQFWMTVQALQQTLVLGCGLGGLGWSGSICHLPKNHTFSNLAFQKFIRFHFSRHPPSIARAHSPRSLFSLPSCGMPCSMRRERTESSKAVSWT
jgi:hypothetical protein